MKSAFRFTRWAFMLVLVTIPVEVLAEPGRSREVVREVTLDINRDGRPDRAVLARNDAEGSYVDLTIYLGVDADKPDPAREPSIVKRRLASGHLHEMTAKGNGSLRVVSRCGGCSNDDDTTFTIVYRAGDFLVGGFSRSWELRDGSVGNCDVNYLTGKGLASKGLPARDKAIGTAFRPIRLADWSEEKIPRACRPCGCLVPDRAPPMQQRVGRQPLPRIHHDFEEEMRGLERAASRATHAARPNQTLAHSRQYVLMTAFG